jgi:tetratricopeptide (TPR) repeat protein
MRTLSLLPLACFTIASVAHAQRQADGSTLRTIPGLAIVKPQAWSKDSETSVVEFTGYIDRKAVGHAGAGYFELQLPSGQRRQVDVSRVVKLIEYPDPERVRTITDQNGRQGVEAVVREVQAVIERFPATRSYLKARLDKFAEQLTTYDSGKVKLDGQWIPRNTYYDSQALKVAEILEVEIERAHPPGSFNLDDDPKFMALREMAAESSVAKKQVERLSALQAGFGKAERRRQILAKLAEESFDLATCQRLVTELGTLSPETDPASAKVYAKWKAGLPEAAAIAEAGATDAATLEAALAGVGDPPVLPTLDPALESSAKALSERIRKLKSGGLPAPLANQIQQAESVALFVEALPKLDGFLKAGHSLDAKELLDSLAPQADTIGPGAEKAVATLQRESAARIDMFTKIREEAKTHAEAGRRPEALAKFQEAFAIIPDPTVGAAIAELDPPKATQ